MANQEAQQPSRTKPGFFYGYIVVIAIFFIMVAGQGLHEVAKLDRRTKFKGGFEICDM